VRKENKGMNRSTIVLILLAVVLLTSPVLANTYFDVVTGFRSNLEGLPNNAPTEWNPYLIAQPHNNGWSYVYDSSSATGNIGGNQGGYWYGSNGSAFTITPSDYVEMDREWSLGRTDQALAWGSPLSSSPVCNADGPPNPPSSKKLGSGTPWGNAVGMNGVGGGSSVNYWSAIKWTAPAAGYVTPVYTVSGVTNAMAEPQLGKSAGSTYTNLAYGDRKSVV
jgi:hypothetical protein